jgi:DNA ligase-associated metallophosphoesterase
MVIDLAGHELVLMPERAVYWPQAGWLFVADTHWGKCQAFRDAGSALPVGPLRADLERLRSAAERTEARKIVVLGDLVHGSASFADGMDSLVCDWRATLPCGLALVPGNHDRTLDGRRAAGVLERWGVERLADRVEVCGLTLAHAPLEPPAGPTLCGHVHPAVRMRGPGESMKLPCFWLDAQRETLVLPAFARLADGAVVGVRPGDARWISSGSRVLAV